MLALKTSSNGVARLGRWMTALFGDNRRGDHPRKEHTARPCLEGLEARLVLSLTPVAPSAGYPYTTIVEIQATFPDHKTFVGSGVMIDRFHVLTAGHVLYSSADGGFASTVAVNADESGSSHPFGTAYATYDRTYNAFINYNKAHPSSTTPGDNDIGLVTLDRTLGDRTGWMSFGYDNNNADFSKGQILNTAGYPAAGGYNGAQMEFSSGGIAGLSSDGSAIQYNQSSITTYGGQSGSAVWRYNASTNSRVVYGIHVAGSGTANSLNFATRITQAIFNDLQSWRNADAVPASSQAARLQSLSLGTSHALSGTAFRLQDGELGSEGDSGPAPIDSPTFQPIFDSLWANDARDIGVHESSFDLSAGLSNSAMNTEPVDLAFGLAHPGSRPTLGGVESMTDPAYDALSTLAAVDFRGLLDASQLEHGTTKSTGDLIDQHALNQPLIDSEVWTMDSLRTDSPISKQYA